MTPFVDGPSGGLRPEEPSRVWDYAERSHCMRTKHCPQPAHHPPCWAGQRQDAPLRAWSSRLTDLGVMRF